MEDPADRDGKYNAMEWIEVVFPDLDNFSHGPHGDAAWMERILLKALKSKDSPVWAGEVVVAADLEWPRLAVDHVTRSLSHHPGLPASRPIRPGSISRSAGPDSYDLQPPYEIRFSTETVLFSPENPVAKLTPFSPFVNRIFHTLKTNRIMTDTTNTTTAVLQQQEEPAVATPVQQQAPIDSLEAQIFQSSRRIMVAEDGSNASRDAFFWAVDNVLQKGDVLVVARVLSDDECFDLYQESNDDASNNLARAMQKCAEALLEQYASAVKARRPELNDVTVLTDVKVGTAKTVICELAKEMNVELIVMGKRGLGPLKRLLLGSVSDYVARHAECPVTVIPSKPAAAQ
ncbi:hypothetical protein HDU96_011039 [Phlyctochytrium bullatum]|nr:hypothetical protein HDU96_011039 [Phlyctochytrium bullatum]